jgi:hypothetical protein
VRGQCCRQLEATLGVVAFREPESGGAGAGVDKVIGLEFRDRQEQRSVVLFVVNIRAQVLL